MTSLVHILHHVHISLRQDIIGIVRPLEKVGGSKITAVLHLGKMIGSFHTVFHIVAHNNKLIPVNGFLISGLSSGGFNDLDDFAVILV